MAKKTETIVSLTDDLDGSKGDRTIAFTIDGASYEIELSKRNAAAFERGVKPYVEAARKVRGSGGRSTSSRSKGRNDLSEVREWAKSAGFEVSDRGRISKEVQDAYDAR